MIAARVRRHAAGLGFGLAASGVAFAVLRHGFENPSLPPGVDAEYHAMYLQFLLEELLPQGRIRGWFPYTYNGFTGFLLYPPGFYLFGASLARLFQLSAPAALELAGAAGYALYPISCYAFLRLLGQRPITAWFGGTTGFLVRTDFGLGLDGLVRQGAYANAFGIPLLVLYLGVLFVTCRRLDEGAPSTRSALGAGALLALLLVSHIHSSIVAAAATAFAFLGLLLLARPSRGPPWPIATRRFALIAGVALGLSSFFVVPFLDGLRERGPVTGWGTPDPAVLAHDLLAGRSLAPTVVVLLALAGIGASALHASRGSVAHFTLLGVGLLSVCLAFGWVPASGPLFPMVHPLESRALLYLAVLMPSFAAIAVAPFAKIRGWSRGLPLLALLLFASVRLAGDERAMAATFSVRTRETLHALARELERHLPPGSRFFVEGEGAALRHPSYLHHYPFLTLAILSGRSTIQGDSIEQSLSGDNARLVPEPEEAATPAGARTLSSLGVTHVITTTPAGAAALGGSGRFAQLAEVEGNVLFRVSGSQGISTEPGGEARIRAVHRELLHLHVRSDSATSEVRLPISYSRRWRLSVDGEAAPIARGNPGRREFVLSGPGEHEVRIEYRNPWLDLASLLLSGASLAAVLAYLGCLGRGGPPS